MRLSRGLLALGGSHERSGMDHRVVNKGERVSLSGWLSPIFEKYPEYRRGRFLFGATTLFEATAEATSGRHDYY